MADIQSIYELPEIVMHTSSSKLLEFCLLGSLAVSCGTAFGADDTATWSLKGGLVAGRYSVDSDFSVGGNKTSLADENERIFGGMVGTSLSGERFFGDLSVEFMDIDAFDVSELLGTVGYVITPTWSFFAGARLSWQGDGLFDDEFYKERGPFVGVSAFFPVSEQWAVGLSGSYNRSRFDFTGAGKDDGNGYSLKAQLNRRGTGHSLGIRFRTFDVDTDLEGAPGKIELTEEYLTAYYQYSFVP